MKNINIITFFWSNNLGALIQAYSLKNYIQKQVKNKVCFNSYSPKKLIVRERMSQINSDNLKILGQVCLKKLKLFYWKKKYLKCKFPTQNLSFFEDDLYIYGSDEIWNYKNSFFGLDTFFFGKNNKKKKITYAVSVGNLNLKKNLIKKEIKEYVRDFDDISVRDLNSQLFVKYCTGVKPQIVLDPCHLVDLKNQLSDLRFKKVVNKKFAIVYGNYFNINGIKKIKKICKTNNLLLISVGFYNDWVDKNIISINPVDLINYIKNSKVVFTSMFHGVMLSYKYKKQFWISVDPYRVNKLSYFIDYLGLKKRYIENIDNKNIDYKVNFNKFTDWLGISKNFLNKHIK